MTHSFSYCLPTDFSVLCLAFNGRAAFRFPLQHLRRVTKLATDIADSLEEAKLAFRREYLGAETSAGRLIARRRESG
jgi:hypothetical protein